MGESWRQRSETWEWDRERASFGAGLPSSPLQILLMPDAVLQTATYCSLVSLGFALSPWRTLALKQRVLSWLRERERLSDTVSQVVSREMKKQAKFMLARTSVRMFLQFLIRTQAFERGKKLIKIVEVFLSALAKEGDTVQIESHKSPQASWLVC